MFNTIHSLALPLHVRVLRSLWSDGCRLLLGSPSIPLVHGHTLGIGFGWPGDVGLTQLDIVRVGLGVGCLGLA